MNSLYWLTADCTDGGSSKHIWNVGQFIQDYVVKRHSRLSSLKSLHWEAEIPKLHAEKAYSEEQPVPINIKNTEDIKDYITTFLKSTVNFTSELLPGKILKMMIPLFA